MLRLLLVAKDPVLDPRILATFERDGVSLTLPARREGLAESVAADPPDAAALDLGLPDGEGWRLLRSLREHLDSSSLPIVGLTSQDTAEERLRAFSLGADDVMRNPFDAHELVLRTRGVVAAQRDRSAALRGSLEIYPLPGLLQSCERSSCTGLLKISGGTGEALVRFRQGKIVTAEAGELSGLPALWSALENVHGDFVLTVDPAREDGDQDAPSDPVVASVRGLLIEMAWASEEESDEPQIVFPDDLPTAWEPAALREAEPLPEEAGPRPGGAELPVLSIFYAPAARADLRDFLAQLPAPEAERAGIGEERGELALAAEAGAAELQLRFAPLAPSSIAEMLAQARESAGIVLWLGSDLSAGGVPMALQLLGTAARGAERLILVAEPLSAGREMLAQLEAPSRWSLAPSPQSLAAVLRDGAIPLSAQRASKPVGAR